MYRRDPNWMPSVRYTRRAIGKHRTVMYIYVYYHSRRQRGSTIPAQPPEPALQPKPTATTHAIVRHMAATSGSFPCVRSKPGQCYKRAQGYDQGRRLPAIDWGSASDHVARRFSFSFQGEPGTTIIARPPMGCTGRLLGPPVSACRRCTCSGDTVPTSCITIQRTPSVHGGVVRDPSYP